MGPKKRPARGRGTDSRAATATRWPIPWIGRIGRGDDGNARAVRHLFSKASDTAPGQGAALTWIYGNAGETGFYRVQHGDAEWEDLLAARSSLSPLERIGLLGHQWALARTGQSPLSRLLDLVASLGDEDEPDVLAAVERVLTRLLQRVAPSGGTALEARLRAWIEVYFGGQVDALGLVAEEGEERSRRERRAHVFSIVGLLGRAEPIGSACSTRTAEALAGRVPLAAELADATVRIAASRGGPDLAGAFVSASRQATTPQARRRWLLALAELGELTTSSRGLGQVVDHALDRELAPAVDRAGLLSALLARPETAEPTWQRLARAWTKLEREWPPILLARVAGATGAALAPEHARGLAAFFKAHPLAAGPRTPHQVAEELAIARESTPRLRRELEAYLGGDPAS